MTNAKRNLFLGGKTPTKISLRRKSRHNDKPRSLRRLFAEVILCHSIYNNISEIKTHAHLFRITKQTPRQQKNFSRAFLLCGLNLRTQTTFTNYSSHPWMLFNGEYISINVPIYATWLILRLSLSMLQTWLEQQN